MIELIVGGARSGKSGYALSKAKAGNGKLYFIATAQAKDREMQDRIKRHQQERGSRWHLIEEPEALSKLAGQFASDDIVLVDCLTLWLSNWLCSNNANHWIIEKEAFIEGLQQSPANWLLVSSEVGMGVIPMGDLSRLFVDECGALHQQLARIADRVTLVMFGLPQTLKPAANQERPVVNAKDN